MAVKIKGIPIATSIQKMALKNCITEEYGLLDRIVMVLPDFAELSSGAIT